MLSTRRRPTVPAMDTEAVPSPAVPARQRRRLKRVSLIGLVVLALLSPWEWSLGRAMTSSGTDSEQARVAEWVRGQGGGPLVTWAENLRYKLHPARVGGAPASGSPLLTLATRPQPPSPSPSPVSSSTPSPAATGAGLPAAATRTAKAYVPATLDDIAPLARPALPGEGAWSTLAAVRGLPAMRVAYLRPDAVHTSYTSAVVWMSQHLLRTVYHPGTLQPGGGPWSLPSDVAGPRRTELLAAYNSAFRLGDAKGGFYDEGRTVAALRPGAASLLTTSDGRVQVGSWGTDVTMSPRVASVRQNLVLIVDKGSVVPSINDNTGERWGQTISYRAFVWRSGVGVTASGDVVFAMGNGLSAATLAGLLVRAGAVRAMELDINPDWTTFITYGQAAAPATEHRLLPDMVSGPDRYDTPSTRDFYAVYARS